MNYIEHKKDVINHILNQGLENELILRALELNKVTNEQVWACSYSEYGEIVTNLFCLFVSCSFIIFSS